MSALHQDSEPKPFSPFGRIALALSGGGFRAASYNLGAMSFLNEIKISESESLLDRVVFIGSASGGTITNAFYTRCKLTNTPFETCYHTLTKALEGEKILISALDHLQDDSNWERDENAKHRNLINSFAKAYDEFLFEGETIGLVEESDNNEFSVCFNSTDFYRGISFRFQLDNHGKSKELLGNGSIYIDRASKLTYQKLKLADILAASSCFPAGFEPMVYPEDFTYQQSAKGISLSYAELEKTLVLQNYDKTRQILNESIGLMDGGITDNQALYSTMLADGRSNGKFDLIIVSDVASYFIDPYKVPRNEGTMTKTLGYYYDQVVKHINRFGNTVQWGFILSILLLCVSLGLILLSKEIWRYVGFTLCGFSLAATILFYVAKRIRDKFFSRDFLDKDLIRFINRHLEKFNVGQNFSPEIIKKLLSYLSQSRFSVLQQMFKARLYSVLIMATDINLKTVRGYIYKMFFRDSRWDHKRIYNVIYELSTHNRKNRTYRINKLITWASAEQKATLTKNIEQIENVAESARTMGTTLWFDQSHDGKLKDLIACGQFTMCSNLLEYLFSISKTFTGEQAQLVETLKTEVELRWEKFKQNPYHMYEEMQYRKKR